MLWPVPCLQLRCPFSHRRSLRREEFAHLHSMVFSVNFAVAWLTALHPSALYQAERSTRRDEFSDISLSRLSCEHTATWLVPCCCYLISGRSVALHTGAHRGLSSSTFHVFVRPPTRPVLSCPALPYPALSCTVLSCPVLFWPALPCHILPCLTMP